MTSLYINPLTFNCKKNEIALDKNTIEWKKQIATVAKKKDLSAIEYLNQKYGSKINIMFNMSNMSNNTNNTNKSKFDAVVFAYFDYIEDSTIYLMYIPDDITIELYFDSYIPSLNMVEIVDGSYDIKCFEDKIIVKGYIYAFCILNESYYFKPININQYIEYVQRNNDVKDGDENDEEVENEDENDEEDDNEEDDNEDDEDDEDDEDENDEDEDDEEEDEDEDEDDDEEDEDVNIDDIDAEIEADVEADAEVEDEDDDEDNDEDNDEDEDKDIVEEQNIVEDEEVCNEEDFVDFEPEIEKIGKVKKTKQIKSSQSSTNNEDYSIILHILNPEIIDLITPEIQLHPKRQMNIQILKTINLPIKTIQLIEKGIYNYVIEKCNFREIIPIWDNPEFLELYVSKSKHIYSNLSDRSYVNNSKLIDKIKNNTIIPYELAFMETYKLFPEKWADIIDEKLKVDKMLKESLQECATDLFECPRCHKHKTIYLQIQLRSSDEPMTNFITCMNCGNKWQFD